MVALGTNLIRGLTRSCGCGAYKDIQFDTNSDNYFHNKEPLYVVWMGIKARCYNPTSKSYKDYGAKGIIMCEEWRYSFLAFKTDMEPTYKKGLTIERDKNNLGYNKENCRWIPKSLQGRNRSMNKMTEESVKELRKTFDEGGVTKAALARRYGITSTNTGDIISGKIWKGC